MGKAKSKFDLAAERATLILQEHFDSLPPKMAKEKRVEFSRLISEMARRSRGKGKPSSSKSLSHQWQAAPVPVQSEQRVYRSQNRPSRRLQCEPHQSRATQHRFRAA